MSGTPEMVNPVKLSFLHIYFSGYQTDVTIAHRDRRDIIAIEYSLLSVLVTTYVTVYRKTRHNAAPFEKFFFALTELSASRY